MVDGERVLKEGSLKRLRSHGIHLPPFRTKWTSRYYVLRTDGHSFILDEFNSRRRDRLQKSIDLRNCQQVECGLQLSDSSCTTMKIPCEYTFSLSIVREKGRNAGSLAEMFLVAENEAEMNTWVTELCGACRFVPREADMRRSRLRSPLLSSSEQSSESLIDRTLSDVRSEAMSSDINSGRRHYEKRENSRTSKISRLYANNKPPSIRDHRHHESAEYANGGSSCASISSSLSSHGVDDDVSSVHSSQSVSIGPPVPPRGSLNHQVSTGSSSFGSRSKVLNITIDTDKSSSVALNSREDHYENDSSGETIKVHQINHNLTSHDVLAAAHGYVYPTQLNVSGSGSVSKTSSVCSSMAVGPHGGPPPPIDRRTKPPKLQLTMDSRIPFDNCATLTRTPRTPQATSSRHRYDGPRSADPLVRATDLDYIQPAPARCQRAHSEKSTADLEYIRIDVDKTQAVQSATMRRS